jgi:hypothetical protein
MPLNAHLVEAAIKSGLSAVCATCHKYWEGREKGLPEPKCTAITKCGSPLVGDDFHEYDGPMTTFDRWCFVCADKAKYGVTVRGRKRVIGVCQAHIKVFGELSPVGAEAGDPTLVADGKVFKPEDLKPREKPSLFAAIQEAEKSFEKG